MLGLALLAAIALGLGRAWYRFIWTRHPSRLLRRAASPHDMIDVPLAPAEDQDQRPARAGSARSARLA
jgi:hypothetical protein